VQYIAPRVPVRFVAKGPEKPRGEGVDILLSLVLAESLALCCGLLLATKASLGDIIYQDICQ